MENISMDLSNFDEKKLLNDKNYLRRGRLVKESKRSARFAKFLNLNNKTLVYLFLITMALVFIFPFIWSVIAPFNNYTRINKLGLNPIPKSGAWTTDNYDAIFHDEFLSSKIGIWMKNSFIYSVINASCNVVFDFLAGYALARIAFSSRRKILWYLLAGTMIPGQIVQVPQFLILIKMGVIGGKASDAAFFAGILFTSITSATWVFMARQYFINIGASTEEAGAIDGLSKIGVFFRISLKQVIPLVALVWTMIFMASWNNFIMFNMWAGGDVDRMNMTAGLNEVAALAGSKTNNIELGKAVALTATNIVVLPVIVVYLCSLFFQRKNVVEGEK